MNPFQLQNLSKEFGGVKAIRNLTLEIASGMITGIIGPNGSGKSTLINIFSGMMAFEHGRLLINGFESRNGIDSSKVYSLGITRTFQEVRLFNQMTVLDNLLVVLSKRSVRQALFEMHRKDHFIKARELLERFGLETKEKVLALNLSYGQRKLLEVARALATGAEAFLLDEPFAGLFPWMIKIVSDAICELRMQGKTIILVEHNVALIRELCDWVIVLDGGEFLAEGRPNEVLARKEVLEAYLGT